MKISEFADELKFMATEIYLLLIFLIFPLYTENYYQTMGECKWRFYLYVTVAYLATASAAGVPDMIKRFREKRFINFVCTDYIMIVYAACVVIGLFTAADKGAAWTGAEGWHMGAAAQLLFILSYFVISRNKINTSWFLGCILIGSTACFLIGILQRLGFDLFNMYNGMDSILLSDFISTIGNRTWMSGYASAVFPIGVYLFWKCDSGGAGKVLLGIYSAIAFMGIAAAYSDSAYIALIAVFAALCIMSMGNGKKLMSLGQLLCIWFGASLFMCAVRAVCGDKVRDARGLSCYVYEWKPMLAGLAASIAVMFIVWMHYRRRPEGINSVADKDGRFKLRMAAASAVAASVILIIVIIILNTTGSLERFWGVSIHNPFFVFNDAWGDGRGWTWKMTCEMFADLTPIRKLFGVGADCFGSYAYDSLEYGRRFAAVWGDSVLTNAHNEWLNMFFCQGIIGGTAYLGIFISAVYTCIASGTHDDGYNICESKSLNVGIGLCIIAYMAHNFFCYQQVCATGIIFVLMGISGSKKICVAENDKL